MVAQAAGGGWGLVERAAPHGTGRYYTIGITYSIIVLVIRSFRDRDTRELFDRQAPRRWIPIARAALRRLRILHRARTLNDLRVPPGNRLEALKGDRAGRHSIRVNDQYRICFRWEAGDAYDVELIDYH
jgi:proteic killer suppression protein